MGNQDRPHATKRTRPPVMPTVEEIVEEARLAREARLETLVKVADLAVALNLHRSNVAKTCRKMGLEYAYTDRDCAAYITKADAAKVAERLA